MQTALSATTVHGEYLLLEVHPPGGESFAGGVLLVDPRDNRLHVKLLGEWPASVDPADGEILTALADDLSARAAAEGAETLLAEFESSFSHLLRLSERKTTLLHQPLRQLESLFAQHVARAQQETSSRDLLRSAAEIVPFRTHLPYFPMRIAAGVFDGDMEVEADGWVPVPAGVRPAPGHFVARITGHSMEPRVPDGSYCLFKANPQGSREGKLLLVQKHGASDSGGEFTIKRYHSEKRSHSEKRPAPPEGGDFDSEFSSDASWSHARVRLISLNPDYPSWDLEEGECKVIAEFVRVLDAEEVPDEIRER